MLGRCRHLEADILDAMLSGVRLRVADGIRMEIITNERGFGKRCRDDRRGHAVTTPDRRPWHPVPIF